MKPTLLVLAAGIGSRYGGLKQIDPIGPGGEAIIDYSVYDAIRAGFGKVVFVIRHDIEVPFRSSIAKRFEDHVPIEYVFQEMDAIPEGFSVPPTRKKPWGTGHAILVAADAIGEPFGVINADDFYGAASYRMLSEYLQSVHDAEHLEYSMVGFVLRNTLSEFGSVSRGVCQCNSGGYMQSVVEHTQIQRDGSGAKYSTGNGKQGVFSGDEIVSMNLWGFTPSIFSELRTRFVDFLRTRGDEDKSEFFIPSVVNELVALGKARVKVLTSPDSWFGITYPDDKPTVVSGIKRLIAAGQYPEKLWK